LLRAWFSPENITREKAMQIPALAGAIDEIARTVANIPIKIKPDTF
jgi:phage portal protein BeeE